MTDTERRQYVEEWKTSGMSMAAFCRGNGLKYPTFRLWLKKFDEASRPEESTDPGLVKLEIPPAVRPEISRDATLEIHYSPYVVTVPGGFDVSDLTRVLLALKDLGD